MEWKKHRRAEWGNKGSSNILLSEGGSVLNAFVCMEYWVQPTVLTGVGPLDVMGPCTLESSQLESVPCVKVSVCTNSRAGIALESGSEAWSQVLKQP